jgi:FkbM family methyltransferase
MIKTFAEISEYYPIKGVIVIGAWDGAEYSEFAGVENMMFFEPIKENYERLIKTVPVNFKTFNLALGNMRGVAMMYVETKNKGMSCSVLEPGTHLESHPDIIFDKKAIVNIDRLDNIDFDRSLYNMILLDVQGYELEVLKGAEETLKSIDIIHTEVNTREVYKGCALIEEIDIYLSDFKRVETRIHESVFYGDAIYIR